jgi:putative ABC transport system ATP-binding protein
MIQISKLEKFFTTEQHKTIAPNKISFEVEKGEFVSIMGPSGSGKSTLLNILGLLDDTDGGSLIFNDKEVANYNERQHSQLRKHNIGFAFQSFNLIDELTVFEKVEEVLDRMQIMHRRSHFPTQLSGGQQQRVMVARPVINVPKLILADEPTGNLDGKTGNKVMELLTELNNLGATIVMVKHSEHDAKYGNRIIQMLDGEKVTENILTNN